MLIVGLGNPGKKYELTRHNIGFWVVETYVESVNERWSNDSKSNSLISKFRVGDRDVAFMKPLTYMNHSGDAVREYMRWNEVENLVVIYDELDFEAGVIKLKNSGSAGGHNGLSDIIQKTNDQNVCGGRFSNGKFLRIRLGIGHPRNSETPLMEVTNWVLSKAHPADFERLKRAVKVTAEGLKVLIEEKNVETAERTFRSFLDKKKEQ